MEADVVGQVEAQLIDVEAEAAVEVADEDLGGVDAEVGGGCRRGRHGEIITRGSEGRKKRERKREKEREEREEEKRRKKKITQSAQRVFASGVRSGGQFVSSGTGENE